MKNEGKEGIQNDKFTDQAVLIGRRVRSWKREKDGEKKQKKGRRSGEKRSRERGRRKIQVDAPRHLVWVMTAEDSFSLNLFAPPLPERRV